VIVSSATTIVVIKINFVITCMDIIVEILIRLEEIDTSSVTIPTTFGALEIVGLIARIEVVELVPWKNNLFCITLVNYILLTGR